MQRKRIDRLVALGIVVGALMKLFDAPYGSLVFTISFSAFFLVKLLRLFQLRLRYWTGWHYAHLTLILIAWVALVFRYFEYPYSFAVFAVALIAELLVSTKIKINQYVTDDSLRSMFRFLIRARKNA